MKTLAVSTHTATIKGKQYDGIGNSLRDTLNTVSPRYLFVRHSMEGEIHSEVQVCDDGEIVATRRLLVAKRPSILRYISEIIATVFSFMFTNKVDVYVGVNPLNAVAGIILKRIGRVGTAIFYTADYSPSRFNNKLLNNIYHWLDRYCVANADETWSVSTRITSIRENMGLGKEKNIFVPNVPPAEYGNLRTDKFNKYQLVTAGIIDKQLDYEGIMRAVAKLREDFPEISLLIIGNGPEEDYLKKLSKKLNIEDKVTFTGRLPLSETLQLVSGAGIGLALYTGIWGFNYYGDSTKCREYFSFGLPVLSTDTHATVEEMREFGAGEITELDVNQYIAAIKGILSNYDVYSAKSLSLGNKYKGVHRKEFIRILS